MPQFSTRALLALIITGSVVSSQAASLAIGVATVNGGYFQVDNSRVPADATLFDGQVLQTESASSRLHLNGGTQVDLGADSRAQVFGQRLVLEKGLGELANANTYEIDAHGLRITPVDPSGIARVRWDGSSSVVVTAVNGPVTVSNKEGVLVAKMTAGSSLSFDPQDANAAPGDAFDSQGCLLNKGGRVILSDQSGSNVVELGHVAIKGKTDVKKEIGNQVRVTGTVAKNATPVEGASKVIEVQKIDRVATGGCTGVASLVTGATVAAAGITAATVAASGVAIGTAVGVSTAVVAGVAVGAAAAIGGGVAAATKGSSSPQ
jgi:hypothetical protein